MKLEINLIQTEWIATALIEQNTGQIPGVKANPRILAKEDYQKLVKSIEEDPEMLTLNPCWVYPFNDRYVVLNGNQRCEVFGRKKIETVPCKVIPANTPVDKLNRYIIKINAHYGKWDWDMLANEWEEADLSDWGVDFQQWNEEQEPVTAKSVGEINPDEFGDKVVMKLEFTIEENAFVTDALARIDANKENALLKLLNYARQ